MVFIQLQGQSAEWGEKRPLIGMLLMQIEMYLTKHGNNRAEASLPCWAIPSGHEG